MLNKMVIIMLFNVELLMEQQSSQHVSSTFGTTIYLARIWDYVYCENKR
ncbi:MAG: hypothetical protein CLLPBCKN_006787 [Chroococcidiopsis cubana SAG 39.79]|nr:hypothetical protein [Chroococcidiopsis cubana SAG 39.79]